MEDQSIFTNSHPEQISGGLQIFIDSMVEEIVLEGKPFDTQKKYLKKFSEKEGLDYVQLEKNICTFIDIFKYLKVTPSKLIEHTSWTSPSFKRGLAMISINDRKAYINKKGDVVWIQK